MGQCTEALEEQLKSHDDYNDELLIIIRSLTHIFEERQNIANALCDIKEKFYRMQQGQHQLLQKYYESFVNHVGVIDEVGVTITDHRLLMSIATKNGCPEEPNNKDKRQAKEIAMAIQFIRGTNSKFQGYVTHLRNSYLEHHNVYPATLHTAYNVL